MNEPGIRCGRDAQLIRFSTLLELTLKSDSQQINSKCETTPFLTPHILPFHRPRSKTNELR